MTVILTMLRRVEPETEQGPEPKTDEPIKTAAQAARELIMKAASDNGISVHESTLAPSMVTHNDRPHTRRLYHVTVPASKYDLIKSIADLLVGESTSREYLDAARTRCARIALAAVVDAVIGSRPGPRSKARKQ